MVTVYYQDDDVTLYHGDCLAVLPTLAAGSVNAVVTDPPYNVGFDYVGYDDVRNDYREWCRSWLSQARRIASGPVAVSVGQANLSMWATIEPPTWWLAWWKPAAMGRCVVGFNNWEPIALYGKPKKAVCDVVKACIVPDKTLAGHPCPKPLGWATQQILMLTDEYDTILDPFAGSGTTGVACKNTGRKCILVEREESYCKVAADRLRACRSLFSGAM